MTVKQLRCINEVAQSRQPPSTTVRFGKKSLGLLAKLVAPYPFVRRRLGSFSGWSCFVVYRLDDESEERNKRLSIIEQQKPSGRIQSDWFRTLGISIST